MESHRTHAVLRLKIRVAAFPYNNIDCTVTLLSNYCPMGEYMGWRLRLSWLLQSFMFPPCWEEWPPNPDPSPSPMLSISLLLETQSCWS